VIATCQVPKILKDNEMIKDVRVVVKLKAEPIGTYHFGDVEMQEDKEEIVEVPVCFYVYCFFEFALFSFLLF
jgi:hypothetical protein